MVFFSPLVAILQMLSRRLAFGTLAVGCIMAAIVAFVAIVAIWGAIIVFIWNTFLVDYLGAQQITTLGGAILFLLGVWWLGKVGGCVLGCWSLILLAIGAGAVSILDMHLSPLHLLVFAIFLWVFGLGSGSSDKSSSHS